MSRKRLSSKKQLVNNGELELIWLGTGGAFSEKYNNTNLLVIKGNDHVMIDFGITGPQALQDLGFDPIDILNVVPTHSHSDHVGGIEYLAQQNYWIGRPMKNKPKMNLIGDLTFFRKLWGCTLSGGLGIIQSKDGDGWDILQFTDYYNHIRATSESFISQRTVHNYNIGNIKLQIFPTCHIPGNRYNSFGVFIDDKVFYSGDTRFDKILIEEYAPKSEIMFHEASNFECAVHTNIKDLETLSDEIKGKMMLVHCDEIESTIPKAEQYKSYIS